MTPEQRIEVYKRKFTGDALAANLARAILFELTVINNDPNFIAACAEAIVQEADRMAEELATLREKARNTITFTGSESVDLMAEMLAGEGLKAPDSVV